MKKPQLRVLLRQADGIDGRQSLVHVVEQFDVVAELFAEILEELRHRTPILGRLEQFAAEKATVGCGGGNYCPHSPTTRGQMAVFLTKALGLTGELQQQFDATVTEIRQEAA